MEIGPLLRAPLSTAYALLGFIHQGPLHGCIRIYRRLTDTRRNSRQLWRIKQSHLYALLSGWKACCERMGMLAHHAIISFDDDRAQAFDRWLAEPVTIPRRNASGFYIVVLLCEMGMGNGRPSPDSATTKHV